MVGLAPPPDPATAPGSSPASPDRRGFPGRRGSSADASQSQPYYRRPMSIPQHVGPATNRRVDPARLKQTLGRPGCGRLLQRLRQRLERGFPLAGRITFSRPSAEERADIEAVLGRPPGRGESFGLEIEALEAAVIHAGLAPSLEAAVTALTGPVENRKAADAAREARWDRLLADYGAPGEDLPPDWLARLRATGLLNGWAIRMRPPGVSDNSPGFAAPSPRAANRSPGSPPGSSATATLSTPGSPSRTSPFA